MMTNARQFVYQFDDQNEPEEIVIDMRGEQEVPSTGCIITRFGRQWKVVRTATEKSTAPDGPITVHFVALSSKVSSRLRNAPGTQDQAERPN